MSAAGLSLLVGAGKDRPQAWAVPVAARTVEAYRDTIAQIPPSPEAWWSSHVWQREYRKADAWQSASSVAADLDYHDGNGKHTAIPPAVQHALREAVDRGALPGNLYHDTPRGARVIFVLTAPESDKARYIRAVRGACILLAEAIADLGQAATLEQRPDPDNPGRSVVVPCNGLHLDMKASMDLARLYFAPRAKVDGIQRDAEILTLRPEPIDVATLAGHAPEAVRPPRSAARPAAQASTSIEEAAQRWNEDHREDWRSYGGRCPACGHRSCFNPLPENPARWYCWSSNHDSTVGKFAAKSRGYFGDALDLEAHRRGTDRVSVLRQDGYLSDRREARTDSEPPAAVVAEEWTPPEPLPDGLAPVPAMSEALLPGPFRAWLTDGAERQQCPLEFLAVGAIVGLGVVVGRNLGIKPKRYDDWVVVPNVWGLAIGSSSRMKTPALAEALSPIRRLEARARESHREASKASKADREFLAATLSAKRKAANAKIEKAIATNAEVDPELRAEFAVDDVPEPTERRYVLNDATVEKLGELLRENPRGLLLFRDELPGWLRSLDREDRATDRAFYLEAWNGTGAFVYDRIGRGTIPIEAACVSVLGGIQPGPLAAYLAGAIGNAKDNDGLIQRFQLAVYPDPGKAWQNVDRYPNHEAKDRAFRIYEALDNLVPAEIGAQEDGGIPFLRFSPEAQEFFDDWRANLIRHIQDGNEHPAIEAHLIKYQSLMPSLALLFHLADLMDGHAKVPVGIDAARLAAAWCSLLEAHARRIYGQATAKPMQDARLILKRWDALKDGFAARDIYRAEWAGLADPDAAHRALEVLEDYGWIRPEWNRRTGGAPGKKWRKNPLVMRGGVR